MIRPASWLLALLALGALLAPVPRAAATIQEESCIYPDVEYPVPCDEDDD
jgi:hypothetical protein